MDVKILLKNVFVENVWPANSALFIYVSTFCFAGITCPVPPVDFALPNPYLNEVRYPSLVTYTCQAGYQHVGGDLVRTCQADGTLSGVAPTCEGRVVFFMF